MIYKSSFPAIFFVRGCTNLGIGKWGNSSVCDDVKFEFVSEKLNSTNYELHVYSEIFLRFHDVAMFADSLDILEQFD